MDDKEATSTLEVVRLVYELDAKRQTLEVRALFSPQLALAHLRI